MIDFTAGSVSSINGFYIDVYHMYSIYLLHVFEGAGSNILAFQLTGYPKRRVVELSVGEVQVRD